MKFAPRYVLGWFFLGRGAEPLANRLLRVDADAFTLYDILDGVGKYGDTRVLGEDFIYTAYRLVVHTDASVA